MKIYIPVSKLITALYLYLCQCCINWLCFLKLDATGHTCIAPLISRSSRLLFSLNYSTKTYTTLRYHVRGRVTWFNWYKGLIWKAWYTPYITLCICYDTTMYSPITVLLWNMMICTSNNSPRIIYWYSFTLMCIHVTHMIDIFSLSTSDDCHTMSHSD